jgi:deoxyadenosine/deoxycytidine kinase
MNKYIFSVEGNIGSGKSTLLQTLKTQLETLNGYQIIYLQEPVSSWNSIVDLEGKTIIEHFYADQKKYAFSFQMMAYITRLTQLKNAINSAPDESIIITERCLYTDRNIFAKMLYDSKIMDHIEYTIYMKWFNEFIDYTKLSGLIYIETTPEVCAERVTKRSRSGEEQIPLAYLTSCHEYHNDWLKNNNTQNTLNTLMLDGNNASDSYYDDIVKYMISNIPTFKSNNCFELQKNHSC